MLLSSILLNSLHCVSPPKHTGNRHTLYHLNSVHTACYTQQMQADRYFTWFALCVVLGYSPGVVLPSLLLRAAMGFLPASRPGRRCWQGKDVLTFPSGL